MLVAATAAITLALADCDDITVAPAAAGSDLYLACHSPTDTFDVPVIGSRPAADEMDGYVVRLNKDTRKVVYVTRLGGGKYDAATRVAVDARGNAWVAGFTKSADFPTTAGAWQPHYGGGDFDAFLVQLSPSGQVLFATFSGGTGADFGNGIALDGDVPILGGTTDGNAFVQRGRQIKAVFGGSGEEKLTGIALHKGRLWAVGYTRSTDWKKLRGPSDAFVVRLNARTLAVEMEQYFGGVGEDSAWGIAVDRRGRVFIAGQTTSSDLPGAARGYQKLNRGAVDAFVARIGGPATYFGGSNNDEAGYDGQNIAIGRRGDVWIAGITYSADLPAQGAAGGGNGDGFIARFSAGLDKLRNAEYVSSENREIAEGIATLPQGGAAMTMVRFGGAGIAVGPFRAQSVVTFWP